MPLRAGGRKRPRGDSDANEAEDPHSPLVRRKAHTHTHTFARA